MLLRHNLYYIGDKMNKTDDIIAKNLLAGRTCKNCQRYEFTGLKSYCITGNNARFPPVEMTCTEWVLGERFKN